MTVQKTNRFRPVSVGTRISFVGHKKGFHHPCLQNYVRLKQTDPLDTFIHTDYYSFCGNSMAVTCRALEHDLCWEIGSCVRNALERDYRKFISQNGFLAKGIYLERRIQGETGDYHPSKDPVKVPEAQI